ncbi:MAG: hypothetical protein HRU15_11520 [Planctomycetes bacterium]|nr:hypothetical protein [Planctomycetota bacterium]
MLLLCIVLTHASESESEWCEIELSNGHYIYGQILENSSETYTINVKIKSNMGAEIDVERTYAIAELKHFGFSGSLTDIENQKLSLLETEDDYKKMIHWFVDFQEKVKARDLCVMMLEKYPDCTGGMDLLQQVSPLEESEFPTLKDNRKTKNIIPLNARLRVSNKRKAIEILERKITKSEEGILLSDKRLQSLKIIFKQWSLEISRIESENASLSNDVRQYEFEINQAVANGAGIKVKEGKTTVELSDDGKTKVVLIDSGATESDRIKVEAANNSFNRLNILLARVRKKMKENEQTIVSINNGLIVNLNNQLQTGANTLWHKGKIDKNSKAVAEKQVELNALLQP